MQILVPVLPVDGLLSLYLTLHYIPSHNMASCSRVQFFRQPLYGHLCRTAIKTNLGKFLVLDRH